MSDPRNEGMPQAVPANSGKTMPAPHRVQGEILRDVIGPTVAVQAAESYRDEAGAPLKLVEEGGKPVVPGALELSGPRINLASGVAIRKTYVTSSWGDVAPTGAELEGANPKNLPFRQFGVEADAKEGELRAPVESVLWRIQATDTGDWADAEESVGEAIPSSRATDGGLRFYDVVFTQETIPLLRTTTARTVRFLISLEVTDAAGNTTTSGPHEHAYELLDTPLVFVVDGQYPMRMGETGSLYRYRASAEAYSGLFASNAVDFDGIARLGLVKIYNPWAAPVSIQQSNSVPFRIVESWKSDIVHAVPNSGVENIFVVDQVKLWVDVKWDSVPRSGLAEAAGVEAACQKAYNESSSVCGRGWKNSSHIVYSGGSTNGFGNLSCAPGVPVRGLSSVFWGNSLSASHASAWVDPSIRRIASRPIVPAAVQGVAGQLSFYPGVLRDVVAPFGRTAPLENLENGRYRESKGWIYSDLGPQLACFVGEVLGPRTDYFVTRYRLSSWATVLEGAKAQLMGNELAFRARPVYLRDGSPIEGGPLPAPTTVTFSVDEVLHAPQ